MNYKFELADAAGVTRQTFYNWTLDVQEHLKEMGVKRTSKMLPPKAVKFLCEKYDITLKK